MRESQKLEDDILSVDDDNIYVETTEDGGCKSCKKLKEKVVHLQKRVSFLKRGKEILLERTHNVS